MTQEEIIEYNKLCAEFLGAELYVPKPWYYFPKYNEHYYFKSRYEPNRFTLNMMSFHSDWNWIMEVVKAIEKLEIEEAQKEEPNRELNRQLDRVLALPIYTEQEAVIQALYKFLKWYKNEQRT